MSHNNPLLVSWDPESKTMLVSTPFKEHFTSAIVTPNTLWDLLVEFADNPAGIALRETGSRAIAWRYGTPSKHEQDLWLKEKAKDAIDATGLNLSLDDLDLKI